MQQRPTDQKVQLAKLEEPIKNLSSTGPKEALAINEKTRLDAKIMTLEDRLQTKQLKSE